MRKINNSASKKHIVWHANSITKEMREELNNHKGLIIWFTGLSGSGKSTLANLLEQELYNRHMHTYLIDGDNLRHGLNQNLGFSKQDRKENIRRMGEVGKLFVDAGLIVLVASISPFKEDREAVRQRFEKQDFVEIYVKCPLNICEERDPKGLYKKARRGEIKDFTGVSQTFEEPDNPELIVETGERTADECLKQIIAFLIPRLPR